MLKASILNLTQHPASEIQVAEGVVEPSNKSEVQELLTFHEVPINNEIRKRASSLADLAVKEGASICMIGGAPYLMGALEKELIERGIKPTYSFSERQSIEQVMPDGTTRKINQFAHIGWVHV